MCTPELVQEPTPSGLRFHAPVRRRNSESITEEGTRRRGSEHDELVAKQEVLGGDDTMRGEESRERSDYVAKEVDHHAILGLRGLAGPAPCARGHSPTRPPSFCGAHPLASIPDKSSAANVSGLIAGESPSTPSDAGHASAERSTTMAGLLRDVRRRVPDVTRERPPIPLLDYAKLPLSDKETRPRQTFA